MSIRKLDIRHDDKDPIVRIYIDDLLLFTWNDEANIDYPEDLTWSRDLSRIFDAGYNAAILVHNIETGEEE